MRLHALFTVCALAMVGCLASPTNTGHDATSQDTAHDRSAKPAVSTGVRCSNEDWQITFWAEPAMITPVGTMTCFCFQLEDLEGQTSQYSSLNYEDTCDNN